MSKHPISYYKLLFHCNIGHSLAFNVLYVYGDDALSGANQFVLLIGGFVAAWLAFITKSLTEMMLALQAIKSVTEF